MGNTTPKPLIGESRSSGWYSRGVGSAAPGAHGSVVLCSSPSVWTRAPITRGGEGPSERSDLHTHFHPSFTNNLKTAGMFFFFLICKPLWSHSYSQTRLFATIIQINVIFIIMKQVLFKYYMQTVRWESFPASKEPAACMGWWYVCLRLSFTSGLFPFLCRFWPAVFHMQAFFLYKRNCHVIAREFLQSVSVCLHHVFIRVTLSEPRCQGTWSTWPGNQDSILLWFNVCHTPTPPSDPLLMWLLPEWGRVWTGDS